MSTIVWESARYFQLSIFLGAGLALRAMPRCSPVGHKQYPESHRREGRSRL